MLLKAARNGRLLQATVPCVRERRRNTIPEMPTYESRPERFKALRHFAAAAVAIASACCAIGDSLSESDIVEEDGGQAIPSWFLGAWERESIRRGGFTENAVSVHYLQTPTMFGDIRIPSGGAPLRAPSRSQT
jgi:hypothetical protein